MLRLLARLISPAFVYLLISLVLFVVAVTAHFHSSTLSLPISPAISVLAALLPVFAFLNAYTHPTVLWNAHLASGSRVRQLAPFILQALQGLLTTVLATLLLEGVVPSPALNCVLENDWMRRFRAHDAAAIRRIQDVLDCCGYNSVRDRAFPFAHDGPSTCPETYGRNQACRDIWRSAMQSTAGVDFAVVVAIGLMQILGLLMMRHDTNVWTAWRSRTWGRESSRPLLAPPQADDEATEAGQSGQQGYDALAQGAASGPRVEPSSLHEENAWQT